jgi:serine/threonine protein kinase
MLDQTQPMQDAAGASPEDLAAEFLALSGTGQAADVAAFLARLPDEDARREFRELVAGAGVAERGLPRAISAGTVLAGRYRILEQIGDGGMGVVFSAVDEALGCRVAIKVLNPLSQGNREREELFRKESRVLAELKHPGIVAVHDAGSDGDYMFLVMDLVDGTSLGAVLDRARSQLVLGARADRLPTRDGRLLSTAIGRNVPLGREDLVDPDDWYRSCARILLEVTRTLEAAHGKKIVHRDLKPGNVMILGGGNPVLLDFGLAGSPDLASGAVTQNLYGSVCYLAPEQARSQKIGMDPRTDVYQLGLILYEMLTLRRAFPGTAIGEVLRRIETGYFELPHKVDGRVPRDLEAICTMALEVAPERRYAGAREMREDLERWLEGRAPLASRSARWRTLVRTTRYTGRRHPMLAASLAVVLAIGGTALLWSGSATRPSMRAQRYNGPTEMPVYVPPKGSTIRIGEWLGMNLDNPKETYIYAFSRFGREGEEMRIAPWRARFAGPPRADSEPWGLHVGPSRSSLGWNLTCTEILPEAEIGSLEGFVAYASPRPRPDMEGWMQALYDTRGEPMLESEALLMYQQMLEGGTRGVQPRNPDPPAQEAGKPWDWMNSDDGSGLTYLKLPGMDSIGVLCRVAPR